MRAQHMRDLMRFDECGEPPRTLRENGHIRCANIKASRIEAVASEKITCGAVVEGDTGNIMTRDRQDVDYPSAQINRTLALRPRRNAGDLLDSSGFRGDKLDCGDCLELFVASGVIAVTMGMNYHQFNW